MKRRAAALGRAARLGVRDRRGGRAPARQLLRQPPDAGRDLARPRGRALHTRPGRDPDLPGARPLPRRRCSRASAPRSSAGCTLEVDGRAVALRPAGAPRITFPAGQGGLKIDARRDPAARPRSASRAASSCATRPSTAARAGRRSSRSPARARPCARPRRPAIPRTACARYPEESLSSPVAQTSASFAVRPGGGTLAAPAGPGAGETTTSRGGSDGFTGIFSDAASGEGVLLLLLLAAFGWGALHALSPGHGKAMVAAYLIGTRGTAAARRRARRDRDLHAHDRRVRARPRDAAALAVHPARGPVPVAEPRLGAARGDRGSRRAALARAVGTREARGGARPLPR